MKYAVEVKPDIFLDIKIVYGNDVITIQVRLNERKLPVHKVLKQNKRNAIISALNRAACIANFPVDEILKINKSFLMLTILIDLSIVSLKNLKKNQKKLTTTSFPLVCLMFQRRLY